MVPFDHSHVIMNTPMGYLNLLVFLFSSLKSLFQPKCNRSSSNMTTGSPVNSQYCPRGLLASNGWMRVNV